jgi:hypothetical protein
VIQASIDFEVKRKVASHTHIRDERGGSEAAKKNKKKSSLRVTTTSSQARQAGYVCYAGLARLLSSNLLVLADPV